MLDLRETDKEIMRISDLTIAYQTPSYELKAVDGVSLDIHRGEILGIVGESACGKSTLALSLLRANYAAKVLRGTIYVDGLDVLALRGDSLRHYQWEKVAMVFQSAMNALDPVRTVESQIVETMVEHKMYRKQEAKKRVAKLLQLVEIDPSRATSYPHELSGGMRQRVVIALALCLDPKLLIADEPSTALDVIIQAEVLRVLKNLQKNLGLSVILISHDISLMWEMSDRLAVMYAGKVVEIGPTREVIQHPKHPYTEALLNAVPTMDRTKERIQGIAGAPPSLTPPPTGCRFHPRCKYAFAKCSKDEPPLIRYANSESACWLVR